MRPPKPDWQAGDPRLTAPETYTLLNIDPDTYVLLNGYTYALSYTYGLPAFVLALQELLLREVLEQTTARNRLRVFFYLIWKTFLLWVARPWRLLSVAWPLSLVLGDELRTKLAPRPRTACQRRHHDANSAKPTGQGGSGVLRRLREPRWPRRSTPTEERRTHRRIPGGRASDGPALPAAARRNGCTWSGDSGIMTSFAKGPARVEGRKERGSTGASV